ncbi:hypothetical protein OAE48_01380 [Flavobacteriales bacterium]|nr:hypothetical protein [Flavobacteriales bacterium]
MKTLRRLVAVGLLIGSYHVGMAQSNSVPTFKSEAEKAAWIQENPEEYDRISGKKLQWNSPEEHRAWAKENPAEYEAMKLESMKLQLAPRTEKVHSTPERFASEAEKKAWIKANPEEYKKLNSGKTNK